MIDVLDITYHACLFWRICLITCVYVNIYREKKSSVA